MKKELIFNQLVELQRILWRSDDRIDQDDLFEAQDQLSSLVLDLAKDLGKDDEVVDEFPYLYFKYEPK